MSSYKSCDYTPTSDTIAQDEKIEQMSIDPSTYYACNPYGNAAAIEAMAAANLASDTGALGASGAADAGSLAAIPWLKSPDMLKDEEACRDANDSSDGFWLKQVFDVVNPVKQPSIPAKLLQWLLHPSVAC